LLNAGPNGFNLSLVQIFNTSLRLKFYTGIPPLAIPLPSYPSARQSTLQSFSGKATGRYPEIHTLHELMEREQDITWKQSEHQYEVKARMLILPASFKSFSHTPKQVVLSYPLTKYLDFFSTLIRG